MNPVSLEDWCIWYLICHLHEFCIETLALLPQTLRFRILVNLPVVDIWQLEATSFGKGLDTDWLWELVTRKYRNSYFFTIGKFMLHGKYNCINYRSCHFVELWDMVYRDYFSSQKEEYDFFSSQLYSVSAPMGVSRFRLLRDNYRLSSAVPANFQFNPATLQFFLKRCQIWPEVLRIGCMNFGMKPENATLLEGMHTWQSSELFTAFSHFVAKFQVLKLVALHSLYQYGNRPYRAPLSRTDAQNLHRCLHTVPLFIMKALTANAHYSLSCLMIVASTWNRCFQMLAVCLRYLSGHLQDLCLSVHEENKQLDLKVIAYFTELLSTNRLLSFDLETWHTLSEVDWHSKEYMHFISILHVFIHQPSFRCLGPGFPLPSVLAQRLILAFISNSCSQEQTLAIRNVADIPGVGYLPTTVDTPNPARFPNPSNLKLLKLKLSPALAHWLGDLLDAHVHLNSLDLLGNEKEFHIIIEHLKNKSFFVKSLTVEISRPYYEEGRRSKRSAKPQSYVPLLTLRSIEAFSLRVPNMLETLPFLATALKEQAALGTLRHLKLYNSVIGGTALMSDSKLEVFSQFFDAVFSLPHLSGFTLELALQSGKELLSQAIHIIHSKWLHNAKNVRLAKLAVRLYPEVGWEPLEEICVRFIH